MATLTLVSTSTSSSRPPMLSFLRVRTVPGPPESHYTRVLELGRPCLPLQQQVPLWRLARRTSPCRSAYQPTLPLLRPTTSMKRWTTKRRPLRRLQLHVSLARTCISHLLLLGPSQSLVGAILTVVVLHNCVPDATLLPSRSLRSGRRPKR